MLGESRTSSRGLINPGVQAPTQAPLDGLLVNASSALQRVAEILLSRSNWLVAHFEMLISIAEQVAILQCAEPI